MSTMKKVLVSLMASYALSAGQAPVEPASTGSVLPPDPTTTVAPPPGGNEPVNPGPIVPPMPSTTTIEVNPTVPATTTSAPAGTTVAPAGTTVAPATTAAGAATVSSTTAAGAATVSTTAAPIVTPAPTPFVNPLCQSQFGMQASRCPALVGPQSIAKDFGGNLWCDLYQCCSCQEIQCGLSGVPCHDVHFGDFAAIGSPRVTIQGSAFQNFHGNQGTTVDCHGFSSCKGAKIFGKQVGDMDCGGDMGCQGAEIVLSDVSHQMNIDCNGHMGCAGAKITINVGTPLPAGQTCAGRMGAFTEIGSIQFNGYQAGVGATLTINNFGCGQVLVDHLDCELGACVGTKFVLNGNVQISQCDIASLSGALPPQCLQQGFRGFGQGRRNQQFMPMYPQQQQPVYPQQPITPATPVTPVMPASPTTTAATATPATPATPTTGASPAATTTPAVPAKPIVLGNSFEQICFDQFSCANKVMNIMNPRNGWLLECLIPGACANLDLNINVGQMMGMGQGSGNVAERIDALVFRAPNAANGANIRINSMGQQVELESIRCEEYGSCNGVTIEVGMGMDLSNLRVECGATGACFGCTIKQHMRQMPCMAFEGNNQPQMASNQIEFPYPPEQLYPGPGFPGQPTGRPHPYPQQFQQQYPQYPQYQL